MKDERGFRFPAVISPRGLSGKIILLVFALVSVSIILSGLLFYTRTAGLIRDQSEMYARNLCANLSQDIDHYIREMDRVCRIILGNPAIQNLLERRQNPGYSDYQHLLDQEIITNLALSVTSVQDSFIIQLFDENGFGIHADSSYFMSFDQALFDNPWTLARKRDIDGRGLFIVPALYSGLILYFNRPAFYVIRPVRRIRDNRIMGYLTVTADNQYLADILLRYAPSLKGAEARIVSPENVVLFSLNPGETGTFRNFFSEDAMIQVSDFSYWRTEVRIGELYGREVLTETGLFAALIIGLTLAASLSFAGVFTVYLLRPIKKITLAMAQVGKGDFNISLDDREVDRDLEQIVLGFNAMVKEIRNLIRTVHEEKLLVKSAQYEALRYQINPHFLYNTFQTIEAIGEVEGVDELKIIANSLGKLFRYNTQGSSEVFLHEEIDQLDTYFRVEKIRFGEKISWESLVPPELRECRIPKFILQPLAENAVVHGFPSITWPGIIYVQAALKGPNLEITIRDNGTGMDDETFRRITVALSNAEADMAGEGSGNFVGILNVHRRLVNLYGPGYGLSYRQNAGGGTTALLALPAVFQRGF